MTFCIGTVIYTGSLAMNPCQIHGPQMMRTNQISCPSSASSWRVLTRAPMQEISQPQLPSVHTTKARAVPTTLASNVSHGSNGPPALLGCKIYQAYSLSFHG
ncbi:hypothetical protein I7I48_09695 [Histoplasma ohiense]|nr:hypothetical protein I7I48_09695 [Histoplasma ohiense (nom. inval.)]